MDIKQMFREWMSEWISNGWKNGLSSASTTNKHNNTEDTASTWICLRQYLNVSYSVWKGIIWEVDFKFRLKDGQNGFGKI